MTTTFVSIITNPILLIAVFFTILIILVIKYRFVRRFFFFIIAMILLVSIAYLLNWLPISLDNTIELILDAIKGGFK